MAFFFSLALLVSIYALWKYVFNSQYNTLKELYENAPVKKIKEVLYTAHEVNKPYKLKSFRDFIADHHYYLEDFNIEVDKGAPYQIKIESFILYITPSIEQQKTTSYTELKVIFNEVNIVNIVKIITTQTILGKEVQEEHIINNNDKVLSNIENKLNELLGENSVANLADIKYLPTKSILYSQTYLPYGGYTLVISSNAFSKDGYTNKVVCNVRLKNNKVIPLERVIQNTTNEKELINEVTKIIENDRFLAQKEKSLDKGIDM